VRCVNDKRYQALGPGNQAAQSCGIPMSDGIWRK